LRKRRLRSKSAVPKEVRPEGREKGYPPLRFSSGRAA